MEDRRASFKPWIRREHEVHKGQLELGVDLYPYPWNRKVDLQIFILCQFLFHFQMELPWPDFCDFNRFIPAASLVGRSYGA